MTQSILQILVQLKDEASASLGKISDKIKGAESASNNFAKGLVGAGIGLAGLGGLALKAASDAEQTSVAFKTMLGSAEEAQKFVAEMKQFAAKTPFETSDISKAAQTMLAFGLDVKSVMPNIQMIGDVALGNKEKFASLSLAFAQVQATGRLMGQDLLQMVNQGFNPLQIMSEKTGKSMAQLKEEMEDGKISAEMVAEAFKTATSEGGRFFGGMEAQSKTWAGLWSTFKDSLNEFLRTQGERFLPALNKMIEQATSFVQNTLPQWITKIEETIKWFKEHEWAIYAVSGAIIGALVPAIYSTISAFVAAAVALAPFIIGGAIIGGLVAGIVWIVQNWETIKVKAIEIWNAIAGFFTEIWTKITDGITAAWNGVKDFFSAIWEVIKTIFQFWISFVVGLVITAFDLMGIDIVAVFEKVKLFFQKFWTDLKMVFNMAMGAIKQAWEFVWNGISAFLAPVWEAIKGAISVGWTFIQEMFGKMSEPVSKAWNSLWSGIGGTLTTVWEGIKSTIKSGLNWMIDKINSVIRSLNSIAAKGASVFGAKAPQIPEIPMLAAGGIVTRPTLAMIGEAGHEAVIPLSRMNKVNQGFNITVNITGNTISNKLDLKNLSDQVSEAIMDKLRLNSRVAV